MLPTKWISLGMLGIAYNPLYMLLMYNLEGTVVLWHNYLSIV